MQYTRIGYLQCSANNPCCAPLGVLAADATLDYLIVVRPKGVLRYSCTSCGPGLSTYDYRMWRSRSVPCQRHCLVPMDAPYLAPETPLFRYLKMALKTGVKTAVSQRPGSWFRPSYPAPSNGTPRPCSPDAYPVGHKHYIRLYTKMGISRCT